MKTLIFDSFFDKHRGAIAYVRVFEGSLKPGDTVHYIATGFKSEVQEVGYFTPDFEASEQLKEGEVGYIITGTKDIEQIKVGDTISDKNIEENRIPGFKEVQPKVFASIFPIDQGDYPKLKDAIAKLKMSDAALQYVAEHIPALGYGYRCGFLGLLHMDIVQERLNREFDMNIIVTTPSVEYIVIDHKGDELEVKTPAELPDPSQIQSIKEPIVDIEIITPSAYIGKIIELITGHRGMYKAITELSMDQMQITGTLPLAEIIIDFYDDLKSATKGYATVSYESAGFRTDKLVRLDFLVNKSLVEPLAIIVHKDLAEAKGRAVCAKLAKLIPRQQFEIAIQAAIGSRIIARETVKAFRKDVTAGMYGGDMSRRKKLLEKQKKGKKKMKMIGSVEIPQNAFIDVLKKG